MPACKLARPGRFEGGRAHQVPRHLPGGVAATAGSTLARLGYVGRVKKRLLLLIVLLGLIGIAVKKLQD